MPPNLSQGLLSIERGTQRYSWLGTDMKKLAAFGLLVGLTGSVQAGAFPSSRIPDLDKYLSNFAEAEFEATAEQLRNNFHHHLLQFSDRHSVWNDKGKHLYLGDLDALKTISEAEINRISERYFGRRSGSLTKAMSTYSPSMNEETFEMIRHLMPVYAKKGQLLICGLEPQLCPYLSRVFRVSKSGIGWIVDAIEYEYEGCNTSDRTAAIHRCMIYTIGPNRFDSRRWSMISAKKITRSEMEKRLGTKNLRIPRLKGAR